MEKLTTKVIYYPDWNIMMDSTKKDIEFLDSLGIEYSYRILIGESRIEVEFKALT